MHGIRDRTRRKIAGRSPCASETGAYEVTKATEPAMEGSMNPLDSITGTIVSGVILALILAALF